MREPHASVLTPEELANAGQSLYGANWRAELARALGLVDESLIADIEAGRAQAPGDWRARLIALAQDAALRAMDVASGLLWAASAQQPEARAEQVQPAYAPRLV